MEPNCVRCTPETLSLCRRDKPPHTLTSYSGPFASRLTGFFGGVFADRDCIIRRNCRFLQVIDFSAIFGEDYATRHKVFELNITETIVREGKRGVYVAPNAIVRSFWRGGVFAENGLPKKVKWLPPLQFFLPPLSLKTIYFLIINIYIYMDFLLAQGFRASWISTTPKLE